MSAYVLAAGRDRPDHPALIVPGIGNWPHAALLEAVERRAGGFAALGLPAGSRILLRLGNTVDFPVTFLAACAADLVPVPTAAGLTVPEITAMAARLSPAAVVAEAGLSVPEGACPIRPSALDAPPLRWADWPRRTAERLGYIVFTSGSGGRPKAVAHAHRAILARRMMWDGWYGLRPQDRMLHAGAFNWTFTLGTGLLDPWSIGATAIVPQDGTPIPALADLLRQTGATLFAAVPGVFRKMLREPMGALPALRHGLAAGERVSDALRSDWRAATGTDMHEALGMSECSTFISGAPTRPAPPGTVGWPQTGRRVRIADGRLQIATDDPGLMLGYWEGDGPIPPNGDWFDTGDLVRRGPEEALIHEGRADDLLNPGGYRVSPQEVEAALSGLPVQELAIGTVKTPSGATLLAAFYVGPELDETAADAHAADRLAPFKRPRLWVRRESLPRNANGKLLRQALAGDGA
ncbi:MAG: class I adenylate-forming enzyme family protein [Pseudomonadota bacterium]